MTTSHARGIKQEVLNDTSVADYLLTYPDFFERNSQLLDQVASAACSRRAATVSLVERQVEVLRERNQALERKLKELVDVARANDALADRIHRLSQRLIRTRTLAESISAIETSLREDFDAMNSVLVLFLEEARALEPEMGRFLRVANPADADIRTFDSLLSSGKPRCGQVRDAQRDYLFGKDSVEIGSVALTPLGQKGALGILAIGASDAERFHPGMSTEFLSAHRRTRDLRADALSERNIRQVLAWKRASASGSSDSLSHLTYERRMSAPYHRRLPPRPGALARILRGPQGAALVGVEQFSGARLCRRGARRRHCAAQHPAAPVGRALVLRIPDARGSLRKNNPAHEVRAPKTKKRLPATLDADQMAPAARFSRRRFAVGARQGHDGIVLLVGPALERTGGA